MKPWLLLPPQWAHDVGPFALNLLTYFCDENPPEWQSLTWKKLKFVNRLGIAGGVDKNAENIRAWWSMGAGFVEVGTVTLKPQEANPGKIIDRDIETLSLWNKMGFPSHGADEVRANILRAGPDYKTPIFVNIGKNRATPNESAAQDYLALIDRLHDVSDAFVVNISSPNTKGLRELQKKENLTQLLAPLIDKSQGTYHTPILLKLSPDMEQDLLAEAIMNASDLGIGGFILTNTTTSRIPQVKYSTEGGMSGAPLKDLSLKALKTAIDALGSERKNKLIVSAGGVMTAEDVSERLIMGADLVQVYSTLVLNGPGFFREVAKQNVRD